MAAVSIANNLRQCGQRVRVITVLDLEPDLATRAVDLFSSFVKFMTLPLYPHDVHP